MITFVLYEIIYHASVPYFIEFNWSNVFLFHVLLQEVNVETLQKGLRINVYSENNCPGLLVSILEAFEELGLGIQDARVSCSDNFHLQAVGGEVRKCLLTYSFIFFLYRRQGSSI